VVYRTGSEYGGFAGVAVSSVRANTERFSLRKNGLGRGCDKRNAILARSNVRQAREQQQRRLHPDENSIGLSTGGDGSSAYAKNFLRNADGKFDRRWPRSLRQIRRRAEMGGATSIARREVPEIRRERAWVSVPLSVKDLNTAVRRTQRDKERRR